MWREGQWYPEDTVTDPTSGISSDDYRVRDRRGFTLQHSSTVANKKGIVFGIQHSDARRESAATVSVQTEQSEIIHNVLWPTPFSLSIPSGALGTRMLHGLYIPPQVGMVVGVQTLNGNQKTCAVTQIYGLGSGSVDGSHIQSSAGALQKHGFGVDDVVLASGHGNFISLKDDGAVVIQSFDNDPANQNTDKGATRRMQSTIRMEADGSIRLTHSKGSFIQIRADGIIQIHGRNQAAAPDFAVKGNQLKAMLTELLNGIKELQTELVNHTHLAQGPTAPTAVSEALMMLGMAADSGGKGVDTKAIEDQLDFFLSDNVRVN